MKTLIDLLCLLLWLFIALVEGVRIWIPDLVPPPPPVIPVIAYTLCAFHFIEQLARE